MTQESALYDWLIHSVHSLNLTESGCVKQWLEDLRLMTEMECMCVLQGKSLSKDTNDIVLTSRSTKECIDTIRARAHLVSAEFAKLFRKLEKDRWRHIKNGTHRLTVQIRTLLHECNSVVMSPNHEMNLMEQQLVEECAKLGQFINVHLDIGGQRPHRAPVVQLLTALGHTFSALVDMVLGLLIKKLLNELKGKTVTPNSVAATVSHIMSLGLDGDHLCFLIAREGGVGAILDVCNNPQYSIAHTAALRALATICCVPEGIAELEKVGGVESLTQILASSQCCENVKSEAAGVIAQITSPMLDNYQHLICFIENMEDLIRELTLLCTSATKHEVFLLGSAAIANITFMDSMACDFLQRYNTIYVLVKSVHNNKANSLFAKDQLATIFANMAAVEGCSNDIIENNGLPLLIKFLHTPQPNASKQTEMAAFERVLQKSAIALTRLCRDLSVARTILDCNGIPRLVELCRNPKERNNNDSVLVACLALMRKISALVGVSDFRHTDVQELIEPKLMDSFLSCSNSDESFV